MLGMHISSKEGQAFFGPPGSSQEPLTADAVDFSGLRAHSRRKPCLAGLPQQPCLMPTFQEPVEPEIDKTGTTGASQVLPLRETQNEDPSQKISWNLQGDVRHARLHCREPSTCFPQTSQVDPYGHQVGTRHHKCQQDSPQHSERP